MLKPVVKLVLTCFSAVLILSCSGADTRNDTSNTVFRNLINTPLEFVDSTSQKLWEGEIGGRWVTYFRTADNVLSKDIVVVTHDQLPNSYRSMEYCDDDGDSDLDHVKIRMYKQGEGWSDIIIGRSPRSTLNHANVEYKKLIGKINHKRMGYVVGAR